MREMRSCSTKCNLSFYLEYVRWDRYFRQIFILTELVSKPECLTDVRNFKVAYGDTSFYTYLLVTNIWQVSDVICHNFISPLLVQCVLASNGRLHYTLPVYAMLEYKAEWCECMWQSVALVVAMGAFHVIINKHKLQGVCKTAYIS